VREAFESYLKNRNYRPERIEKAMLTVKELEQYLRSIGSSSRDMDLNALRGHLSQLMDQGANSPDRLLDLARYFAFSGRSDLFIHLATILNSYEILPLMNQRVGEMMGEAKRETIFHGFNMPPLGTSPEELPPLTQRIIHRMEAELTPEQCRSILTWNYHEISKESFSEKKVRFDNAASIDEFLKGEHVALIKDLKECLRAGRPWYEQEITQEFVDRVASDQKVQTGVRQGDRIICEKVPFDPKHFYAETNPMLRRYHYCHCPLVRSAIKAGRPKISPTFCYCSAGFEKTAWDAIFDEPVEVDVLQTVLGGGERCVFSIKVPDGKLK